MSFDLISRGVARRAWEAVTGLTTGLGDRRRGD